jgi:Acetokinase family
MPLVAYFSMEIALQSDIPTYSGGLGMLAGDTIRAAADLRLPMVGVSLVHRKGYFRQRLDPSGWQTEEPATGSVDPGLLLYLQLQHGLTAAEMFKALTTRSGLLGISGVSGDFREVESAAAAGSTRAALAYERFVLSVKRAVGAMTSVLGGLDVLVFTGGIGENSSRVRFDVASALSFAGTRLDDEKNGTAVPDLDIAHPDSAVRILVVRAREDLVILREMLRDF